ncbi:AMP-binding protein [Candidatus Poriferisodalis sp.]|uniref:AMP-binding protein n=1 Tax=Candidatus Poriferisodalis sp. TaxID=3101277 RepID=UPI003B026BED
MTYPGAYSTSDPDRPAVIMARDGSVRTFGELEQRSCQFAQLMWAAGLRPGDHVAIFADNNIGYFDAYWAAMRSGLYFTTVNRYLTAEEAAYIVNDCGAQVLLASPAVADVAAEMLPLIGDCGIRLMLDGVSSGLAGAGTSADGASVGTGGTFDGFDSFEDAIAAHPAEPLAEQPRGSAMLYSSGTTGRPKGIKRPLDGTSITDPDLIGSGLLGGVFGFSEGTRYLSPAPLYHSAPLSFSTGTQSVGGTAVVMDRFDAAEALSYIERYRITHSQWVPTMFSRMLKLPESERTRHDLSSHQVAVHAAAPCPVEVKHQMISWWGPILHEYYAGTELNGFCYVNSQEWLERPGTVGKPLIGVIHICDDEGRELPVGEAGTIYFEREVPAFEYHNDPAKTADSRHAAHGLWSTLGDVGRVDDGGYLFLTDRKAFMIISGGVNIYPQEIEDCLVLHPKVADAAVFGVPNEDFGEEVKAVVQPVAGVAAGDALTTELLGYCREHLAGYKVPRTIDFRDELPRLPTGKLYKRILRDEYWGDRPSRIV